MLQWVEVSQNEKIIKEIKHEPDLLLKNLR